jgi:iron complex transport system substrate-binding protein
MRGLRCFLLALCSALLLAGPRQVRVVSQTVGTDELLLAVAEPSQIAALSHLSRDAGFSAVAAEAAKYPQIKPSDAESILRYKPTHVLVASYSRAELVAQLKRSGTKVITIDHFNTLDDAYANLRLIAKELGTEAKAESVIAQCQARLAQLEQRLKGAAPARLLAPSTYGFTGGRDTTFDDLCRHAGAINVAAEAGLVGHVATPGEALLTWKIDYLVLSGEDGASALKVYQQTPPYKHLQVTKAGRYVLLKSYLMSCVTHLRIEGYESLARQLHPERFK